MAIGALVPVGLLRRFDSRHVLVLDLGVSLTRTTEFVQLVVPALAIALRGIAAIGWRWWALTGLSFGIAKGTVRDRPLTFGAAIAARIWNVVERPTSPRVLTFVALEGIAAPAFSGVIDLALRARTP